MQRIKLNMRDWLDKITFILEDALSSHLLLPREFEQKIDLSDIQTIDEIEIFIKDAIEEIELLKESLDA